MIKPRHNYDPGAEDLNNPREDVFKNISWLVRSGDLGKITNYVEALSKTEFFNDLQNWRTELSKKEQRAVLYAKHSFAKVMYKTKKNMLLALIPTGVGSAIWTAQKLKSLGLKQRRARGFRKRMADITTFMVAAGKLDSKLPPKKASKVMKRRLNGFSAVTKAAEKASEVLNDQHTPEVINLKTTGTDGKPKLAEMPGYSAKAA